MYWASAGLYGRTVPMWPLFMRTGVDVAVSVLTRSALLAILSLCTVQDATAKATGCRSLVALLALQAAAATRTGHKATAAPCSYRPERPGLPGGYGLSLRYGPYRALQSHRPYLFVLVI